MQFGEVRWKRGGEEKDVSIDIQFGPRKSKLSPRDSRLNWPPSFIIERCAAPRFSCVLVLDRGVGRSIETRG